MEIDTFPAMPENIWLDIFGYLTLTEKAKVARYDNIRSENFLMGHTKKKKKMERLSNSSIILFFRP